MRKLAVILLLLFSFVSANDNIVRTNPADYDAIYESLQEADFDYLFGIDPKQTDDYTRYMFSPYPLFRSGVNLIFKSQTIPAGYYLLTPREKEGKTWVLFKENGKIQYTIPVYKEELVPEGFYEEKLPYKKAGRIEKAQRSAVNYIGKKWGKRNQRTPIPDAFIDFNDAGSYWDMILYYESKKYYLLFKKE